MTDQLELFDLPKIDRPFRGQKFRSLTYPIWTENKAKLIERYLYYFVLVTHHGTYIDGFAGPQYPDKPHAWAAKLVLEFEPSWLKRFFLCEKAATQYQSLRALAQNHPDRQIQLYNADFNSAVHDILASGTIGEQEATFCLLDQRTFECHWSTIEALARHAKRQYKIELFYFLGVRWLHRAIGSQQDTSVLDAWWGDHTWSSLPDLTGRAICERLVRDLGYRFAHPWPIYQRSDGGIVMYYMIHATDHMAAPALMDRAYRQAVFAQEPIDQLKLEFGEWNFDVED